MIKLKDKPTKRSKHITLHFSTIKRVLEYQMLYMVSDIHIDNDGCVTYYTSEELITQSHPRHVMPFVKKAYGKRAY